MTIAAVAFIDLTSRSSWYVSSKPIGGVGDSPFGPVPSTLFSLSASRRSANAGRISGRLIPTLFPRSPSPDAGAGEKRIQVFPTFPRGVDRSAVVLVELDCDPAVVPGLVELVEDRLEVDVALAERK